GDVAALARKQDGHGAADAGVGAGDDGSHAVQLAGPLPEGRVVHRRGIQRRLLPRLGLVLFREGRFGVFARAGLDRAVVAGAAALALFRVDAGLNLPFLVGDLVGAVFEAVVHGRLLFRGSGKVGGAAGCSRALCPAGGGIDDAGDRSGGAGRGRGADAGLGPARPAGPRPGVGDRPENLPAPADAGAGGAVRAVRGAADRPDGLAGR